MVKWSPFRREKKFNLSAITICTVEENQFVGFEMIVRSKGQIKWRKERVV